MSEKINELNKELQLLKEILINNHSLTNNLISIVEVGDSKAKIVQDFIPVSSWQVKKYSADGSKPIAEAVQTAMEQIENIKTIYCEEGISFYRPLIIVLSDGVLIDNETKFDTHNNNFLSKLKAATDKNLISCVTFYIGEKDSTEEHNNINKKCFVYYSVKSLRQKTCF